MSTVLHPTSDHSHVKGVLSRTKGWCPGALRPMQSGDGLIVRLRRTGGIYPRGLFAEVAILAQRFGNGLVDLSARSNLQIRGVSEETLPGLHDALRALGLLDADAASEAVRNVIGSPLSGCDPSALIDGLSLVRALEDALVAAPHLHELPGKFGFLVDDGGSLPLDDIACDIRLKGVGGDDAPLVELAIGGDARTASAVGLVRPSDAVSAALALAHAFLSLRQALGPMPRRMAGLVSAVGLEAIVEAASKHSGLFGSPVIQNGSSQHSATPPNTGSGPNVIGARTDFLGVGAPFGRLTSAQMKVIADVTATDIRLTPWRALLLPATGADALPALSSAGLITSPDDPRLCVAACPGAPDCSSAEIETREAASRLAPLAKSLGLTLHVSGCPKGCAHPKAAPVTLVGRAGRFDLVVDGRTDDLPTRRALAIDDIEGCLRDIAASGKEER
ncbi:Precorrin-3B synthase [Hartmannibacter diazotrophicus]|uniref:Precorrin-3B synthase n=1 Tax=Hartmannibacter diazotrophicus TaxID=1482074 RepID=A0A2C9D8U4_9HYPH|nr:precorrin-3B synthase [Hartmannibacter diazotrophicus]SON56599.1 Precorrin-3B synthase [Hartmannibacter diazotrophicus]